MSNRLETLKVLYAKVYKRKIDLYYNGDYLCSTLQSKTCKAAVQAYLERISTRGFYSGLVDREVLKHPELLTARFDTRHYETR